MHLGIQKFDILKTKGENTSPAEDWLAVEEPLEIRLVFGPITNRLRKSIAVTMRTPGQDEDLTLGFLFTEGILESLGQVDKIDQPLFANNQRAENVLHVHLQPEMEVNFKNIERNFYTTSSCGVCGKASIDAIHQELPAGLPQSGYRFPIDLIHGLPEQLKAAQQVFNTTGGLHAAALFNETGEMILLREDIGRHNALDKLIGAALCLKMLPLSKFMLMVSGRASFELVQKALMAGIPALAAVGAPSSLAVQLAREEGLMLLGFVRNGRYNIYSKSD